MYNYLQVNALKGNLPTSGSLRDLFLKFYDNFDIGCLSYVVLIVVSKNLESHGRNTQNYLQYKTEVPIQS